MDPAVIALLCLVLSLMLLSGEVFLPTGGALGLLAALALVVSIWSAKQAFYDSRPGMWYAYLMLVMIVVPGAAIMLYRTLLNSEYGKQIVLHAPTSEHTVFDEEGQAHLSALVGRYGVAVSDLRPSGIAMVDDERLDVVSEGVQIEAGQPVRVIKVRGVFPVVRAADQEEVDAFLAAASPGTTEAMGNAIEEAEATDADGQRPGETDPDGSRSDEPFDPFAMDGLS